MKGSLNGAEKSLHVLCKKGMDDVVEKSVYAKVVVVTAAAAALRFRQWIPKACYYYYLKSLAGKLLLLLSSTVAIDNDDFPSTRATNYACA